MKPLVLSVCGDPGGARAVIPVINELIKDQRITLENFAYIASFDVLQQSGLGVQKLDGNSAGPEKVEEIFNKFTPDLLLTATSMHEWAFEKKFIYQAQKLGIPSLSVMDFWSNYCMRFDNTAGNLEFLPTKIAVMDEFCKEEMLSEGFPEDCLVVTGQPAFEKLEQKSSGRLSIDKGKIRSSQGLRARDFFLVFYSQPMRKYFSGTPDYPGFDEYTVLQDLIFILENIRSNINKPLFLGIIPHPTQKVEDFKQYLGKGSLVIDPLEASNELMFSADLVLGMTSSRLMEALIAGCPVLSLQPDCRKIFKYPQTSNGSVPVLTDREVISETIFSLLNNKNEKIKKPLTSKPEYQHSGASRKITNLVYELLGEKGPEMLNAGKEE